MNSAISSAVTTFKMSLQDFKNRFFVCRMSQLLDELNVLSEKVKDLDVSLLDKKVDQMMPELGFSQDDNDRLVASYRCADCHQKKAKTSLIATLD